MNDETSGKTQFVEIRATFGDVGKNWGWLLALGILFIVLGILALGISTAVTVATVLLFGILLTIGGVFQFVDAFKYKGWKSILPHMLIALLYIVAGGFLITQPVAGSIVLTAILGGIFFLVGILQIGMGIQLKNVGFSWGWVVVAGIVSLLLGGMIFFHWPTSSLGIIGLLVAIDMIFHGWAFVMMALALRSLR